MLSSGVSLSQAELVAKLEAEYANASKTGNAIDDKLQEMAFSYTDKSTISTLDESRRQYLKKKKPDYRLYPIYQHIVEMLEKCKPVLDELFILDDSDTLIYTETADHFIKLSDSNKELVSEIFNQYEQVRKRPEELRKGWIKDKVPQSRYSNKGRTYALALEEVGNCIFSLSALVVDFQIQLQSVLKNHGELDVE